MAAKPDLATPGVQNVLVYVSNDNFAQAYAVGHQPEGYAPLATLGKKELEVVSPQYLVPGGLRPFEERRPEPLEDYVLLGDGVHRCDSARSEAAESSCSSLGSADDGLVLLNQDMVVYDSSGVVVSLQPSVPVPPGWKRILANNSIVYISPSHTALSTPEQVKEYLLTAGTCKCGLECHFKYDNVFNFDPKVGSRPWVLTPDTNQGDLTKLCNHKRKILAMASLECKPPDPSIKLRKEYSAKGKKRKMEMPYAGPLPVSQMLGQRDKLALSGFPKEPVCMQQPLLPQQVWQQHQQQQQQQNQIPVRYPDQQFNNRCQEANTRLMAPMVVNEGLLNQNISNQVVGPNGQIISVQNQNQNQNGVVIQGQMLQQQQQQRIFVNQPTEPSGPGRPGGVQLVPVRQEVPRVPYYQNFNQCDPKRFNNQMNGYRPGQKWIRNQMQQNQVYERVPPLHQHSPNTWQEELKRKKVKVAKVKNRFMDCQPQHPCPNIDVRQINDGSRPVMISQSQNSPSFMDDPSGYLAQQTALLNNTINRQNCGFVCSPMQQQNLGNEVPLPSNVPHHFKQRQMMVKNQQYADSSLVPDQYCFVDQNYVQNQKLSRPNSQPSTPGSDDPVTSSTFSEKQASPDSRPIQGGTVSTSNVSPVEVQSDPPTPNATPPQRMQESPFSFQGKIENYQVMVSRVQGGYSTTGVVTAMASGRTGSNTITSVLAGRANTATVSINAPASTSSTSSTQSQPAVISVSKSPLEMVQSVVSSIQVPSSQNPQIIKHSPGGLPPGHILVSSGGQLIMASTQNQNVQNVMAPPPPKVVNQAMPPISVSPMVTNVTAAVTQVIPAVAQQVLGQQTVLVNALPAPFVLQPGVTMTMDGMVGQNVQLPQIVGNVIQPQIQIDDPRRTATMVSPESKKKGKKRKVSQTVAGMLQIAQQNSGVQVVPQGFPQQIQMAHSPQGLTTPVMQALTIVPSKNGGPPQIVMNNNQQLITTNSQPQQINLLQPVNLINGAAGVVQNFPIQQFILPNLGGMVMNADGTATLLQDTSNLGMQLQIQNVNGQNVLTPVQSFNGGQSILAAGPAGMVIRAPSQGKILQQQQHSPGAQLFSPNSQFVVNGQFNGQLSPLVASVSPSQQVTFNANIRAQQPQQQDYIQCGQMGQTLMVPCAPSSSSQNTTYVQNTTIVQQQTTMVSNQQQQNKMGLDQMIIGNDKIQAVVVRDPNYRQSVSTQTAVNQNAQPISTNTFCQTSVSAGSPPDTTTMSPMASEGQSPPTADTTTHSGSTDDGLSPAPSTGSLGNDMRPQSCTMAMVHCVSSSEPDSADLLGGEDWRRQQQQQMCSTPKSDYTDFRKDFGEMVPMFVTEQKQDQVVSSRNYDKMLAQKRKNSDGIVVMERHMHPLFDEEEVPESLSQNFDVGDLVWGPAGGSAAWPGKVLSVEGGSISVRWFGSEKRTSRVEAKMLRTLSEGLDAHHQAQKRSRTSRKLNGSLENAIQEAMLELDKEASKQKPKVKSSGRLRSSNQR